MASVPPTASLRHPGVLVAPRGLLGVAAVEEEQRERRRPERGQHLRAGDDGDHDVLGAGVGDRAAEAAAGCRSGPTCGSTSDGSWYSQPGWCSSEPRWWSTVTTCRPVSRAAAARYSADLPSQLPTSSSGPGTATSRAASYSARPSSSGMKPGAAGRRRAGRCLGARSPGEPGPQRGHPPLGGRHPPAVPAAAWRRTPRPRWSPGTASTSAMAPTSVRMTSSASAELVSVDPDGLRVELEEQQQRQRGAGVGEDERVDRRGDVVAADGHARAGRAPARSCPATPRAAARSPRPG